jgi:octaprenyl-diphosphate synthase
LLDVIGNTYKTGKNVGDDFRECKLTLPFIKAIAKADDKERVFWTNTIEKGKQEEGDLETALNLLNKHGAIDETRRDALEWAKKARDAIRRLPQHEIRDLLDDLSGYVVERVN